MDFSLQPMIRPTSALILFFFISLSVAVSDHDRPSNPRGSIPDVHDILPLFNLPKGIFPDAVESYSLAEDGTFTVKLQHSCYVQFEDQLVYYDRVMKGKLSSGKVLGVSGIEAKKLFIWVPVTGMDMDLDSGMVEFHVGALSQKLPAKQFETIPSFMNKACSDARSLGLKSSSWLVNLF